MKADEKRNSRTHMLYQRALTGKYTIDGKFLYDLLLKDAKIIGVENKTAEQYADVVIERLKKGKHVG